MDGAAAAAPLAVGADSFDELKRRALEAIALKRQHDAASAAPAEAQGGQQAAQHAAQPAGPPQADAHGVAATVWDQDAGDTDAAAFEAAAADAGEDVVQDFDHLLGASERLWEASHTAESLPPGWAKCPNAGQECFGITPIKVRPTRLQYVS